MSSTQGKWPGIVAAIYLLIFVGIWGGLIGKFDFMAIHSIRQQYISQTFPTVPGRVIESRVRVFHGRKSTTYTPVIRYTYRVNGQSYNSNVVRIGMWGGSSQASADRKVREHPVGSAVTVHYNPAKISDVTLEPGVRGGDLLIPLFLLPFNVIPLWMFLSVIAGGMWGGRPAAQPGGPKVIYRGLVETVRLPRWSPGAIALLVGIPAWLLTIVGIFVFAGTDPSIRAAFIAWIIAVTTPIIAYLLARLSALGGRYDLSIDPMRHTLTLPMTFARRTPIEVAAASVHGVHIEEIVTRTSKGGTTHRYELWLAYRGPHGNEERAMLANWGSKQKAEALAQWINEKAGLKASTSEHFRLA